MAAPENESPEPESDPIAEENEVIEEHSRSTKGQKFASDKPSMEEIRRLKKPNTRKCAILLDSSLSHRIDELMGEIEKLEKRQGSRGYKASLADTDTHEIEKLEDELEELEKQAAELTVEFTFQDIGRKEYDKLVNDNPPSDEDKEWYKKMGGEGDLAYSLYGFPPMLVHRTAIDPVISLAEAKEIFEDWSEGDLELLLMTAITACKEPTSLPKSRAGTAKTRASKQNSITPPNLESLTLDS